MKAFVAIRVSQMGWLNSADKWSAGRELSPYSRSFSVCRVCLTLARALDSIGPFISLGVQQITTLNLNCHNAIYSKWDRNNT